MNSKKQNAVLSVSRLLSFLVALLFVIQAPAILASDPPENVRVEDGLLRWDPMEGAISYNIYAFAFAVNGNGFYVSTVSDVTEFQPTFPALYTVVAYYGGNPEVFSDVNAADLVEAGDGPRLSNQEIAQLLNFGTSTNRTSEIRTNRCDNLFAGESCTVMCEANSNAIAAGGACRADSAIVLHQQSIDGGYVCLATADAGFVEVDAVCLFPETF